MLQPIYSISKEELQQALESDNAEHVEFAKSELERCAKLEKPYPLLKLVEEIKALRSLSQVHDWLVKVEREFGGRSVELLLEEYAPYRRQNFGEFAQQQRAADLKKIIEEYALTDDFINYAYEVMSSNYYVVTENLEALKTYTTKDVNLLHLGNQLRIWAEKHKQAYELFNN